MTRALAYAGLTVLPQAVAFGQASAKFEVASIRPVPNWPPAGGFAGERGTGGGCPTSMKVNRGRVDFKCITLVMLIGYAFRCPPDRVKGPDWMMSIRSPRFNIAAKIPAGASENQVPEMFQDLLVERFKLVVHRRTANEPVYALVVAKSGLKLKQATSGQVASEDDDDTPTHDGFYGDIRSRTALNADGRESATTLSNPRMGEVRESGDLYQVERWEAPSISFAGLAELLEDVTPVSLPFVDMTGLKGRYQMTLEVSCRDLPGARRHNPGASLEPSGSADPKADMEETVIRGFNDGLLKLGLRLERRKGPVPTIEVDHAEKIPTDN